MEIASGQHLASGSITKFQPLVILLFLFSVFLTACGGGASSGDSAPAATSASTDTTTGGSSGGSGSGSGDTTRPSVTINSPVTSASYISLNSTISLGGTASDNVGVAQVTWSNSLGGSGSASGTGSWSVGSITLQNGTNTITVTARDAAGNTGTDTLSVTYSSGSGGSGGGSGHHPDRHRWPVRGGYRRLRENRAAARRGFPPPRTRRCRLKAASNHR